MNKTWLNMIIIAVITLALYVAYQFYVSVNGGNLSFNRNVSSISPDLGSEVLENMSTLEPNAPIHNDALNNK